MSRKIFIGFFDKNIAIDFKLREDLDVFIMFYKRIDYKVLRECFKEYNYDPAYNLTITWNNETWEIAYFSKEKKVYYQSVKILRNVLVSYVKDGKPRGWFIGENGKPQRFTGASNSMYFSKSKLDNDMSVPFLIMLKMMFLKEDDTVDSGIKSWSSINSKEALEYKAKHFTLDN